MASDLKSLSKQDMLNAIENAFAKKVEDEYGGEFSFDVLFEYLDWRGESLILESLDWELTYSDNYGGEGRGQEYWYVFKVSDGKTVRHVKVDGWYASYAGGEYDTWFEVFPKQKQVTVWEQ